MKVKAANGLVRCLKAEGVPWVACYPTNHVNNALGQEGVPIVMMGEANRPQPRLDADLGGGMAVSVGRVRPCKVLHCRFVALGHNTVRGAAGAAILNAELMHAEGLLA